MTDVAVSQSAPSVRSARSYWTEEVARSLDEIDNCLIVARHGETPARRTEAVECILQRVHYVNSIMSEFGQHVPSASGIGSALRKATQTQFREAARRLRERG